jgi:hypothetical protein
LFVYYNQGETHRVTDPMITKHLHLAGIAVNQPGDYTVGALRNTPILAPSEHALDSHQAARLLALG